MEYIDFAYVLSTSLTPITLISGAGFLLMTMSGRYEHTTGRVRELLQAKDLAGYENPELMKRSNSFPARDAAEKGDSSGDAFGDVFRSSGAFQRRGIDV